MSLSINVTSPSSAALESKMNSAITSMAVRIAQKGQRGEVPGGPSLELTFMLPGEYDKPSFSGMRMGGYTAQDNVLYFEKPVPEALLNSPRASDFVALVLADVISNAADYFDNNPLNFNRDGWNRLLEQLGIPQ